MSIFEDDPRGADGEIPEQDGPPDPDRPVPGDTTEYIEKGLKESEIETLEEAVESHEDGSQRPRQEGTR